LGGAKPKLQKCQQLLGWLEPQVRGGWAQLCAHQCAEPLAAERPKRIFVGLVVAEVGRERAGLQFAEDGGDCVALGATWRAQLDAAIELVRIEAATFGDRLPS